MIYACLPIPSSLHVETLLLRDDGLAVLAASEGETARCPLCGCRADRVHSRYVRTLADLPWATLAIHLQVRVRKFFCDNNACPRRIFAERLDGVAEAHAHRTDRQHGSLTAIALALGGEAGARLAAKLSIRVSPDTLLRLIRAQPEPVATTPTILGVDDWAIHKGLTYGTILVDLERHRPVDLLPDRSSTSLAAWLQAHPGVRIIARDRAGAYAEGSRAGAPDAVQVADRWHLVDNLADALETYFRPKGTALKAAAAATAGRTNEPGQTRPPPDEIYQGKRRHLRPAVGRARADAAAEERVARRRANYEVARTLHAEGIGVSQIARRLGIARMTVYNYLHGGPPERKRHTMHGQQRVIEPWEPYLLKRWEEGGRMATRLWREIQAQGFAYSLTNVQRFINQLRREGMPTAAQRPSSSFTKIQGPSARGVAALVLQRPERRSEEQRAYLQHLIAQDPAIATTVALSGDFLVMLRRREGERLSGWLEQAVTSGVPELGRFAAKLQNDLMAVQAGLTLRHSNGQTEGQINRLKLLKRQSYGRANVDLLRQRVLAAS